MCALKLCRVIYSDFRNDLAIGSLYPRWKYVAPAPTRCMVCPLTSQSQSAIAEWCTRSNFPNYYESSSSKMKCAKQKARRNR